MQENGGKEMQYESHKERKKRGSDIKVGNKSTSVKFKRAFLYHNANIYTAHT
jgi:hypothetical protein